MPRATQAERRAATRRALLDATIATMVEMGYAATTTTAVVRRAGVSQGALFRYFPTKEDLLASAVEDLYPRLVDAYGDRIAAGLQAHPHASLTSQLLRPLLEAMEQPETRAAVELLVAARTDEGLAARLGPVEASHRQAMRDRARAVFMGLEPDAADLGPTVDAAVDLAIDLTLGISISAAIADRDRVDAELDLAGRLLTDLLPAPTPSP